VIDALVGATLWKKPEAKKSGAGNAYVKASVRATDGEGQHMFVDVVAFSDSSMAVLLSLNDGDSVAVAGTLKIGVYTPRDGGAARPNVSIVAQHVLSSYHVTRKRKAVADAAAAGDRRRKQSGMTDDDLDF
jgi:single-stranded DNA-binding protein